MNKCLLMWFRKRMLVVFGLKRLLGPGVFNDYDNYVNYTFLNMYCCIFATVT
jgi:hypothetical protein